MWPPVGAVALLVLCMLAYHVLMAASYRANNEPPT